MKNLILFFVLAILTSVAFGGSPIIFKGKVGYMLASDGIQYNNDVKILSGSLDPSSTAVDAPLGSTYISSSTGGLYQKADAGPSTNWFPLLIGSAGTGTDNCVARWDGTGTTSIQDALLCVDDLGVATGLTQLLIDNLDINGNTISSTDVNGAINLAPNGTGVVNISGPAASRPMKLDASNNITSGLIDLADSTNDVVGVLPIANGGNNSSAALTSNLIMRSNGTNVIESSVGLTAGGVMTSASIDGANNTITNVPLKDVVFDTAQEINGPVTDVNTMSKIYDHIGSSGIMSGCGITDNGDGTIDIASGTASLKPTSDPHDQFVHINVSAQAGITLTDSATNYVYIDYNAGTPQFATSTSIESFNCIDKCLAYVIAREGTDLSIIDALEQNVDGNRKTRRWMLHTKTFYHQEGGSALTETGTRNIDITSGRFYFMMNQINHAAFDTSGADTFMYHYKNGSGWTATSAATQIDNLQYNDVGTGLATLANNKYKTDWIYLELGNTPTLHVVYSQDEYVTLADAEIAGVPTDVPTKIAGTSEIIGKIIYKKSATSAAVVASVFETVFTSSVATTHNNLSGLQGGAASEYYHFDATEFGFLDGQDQSVLTTSTPTFADLVLSGFTQKSVLFIGATGAIDEDNANFSWDDTANRLGLGTASPSRLLDVNGSSIFSGLATFQGEIGGQYQYMNSTTVFSIPYPRMTTGQVALASNLQGAGAYDTTTDRLSLNDGTYDRPVAFVHDSSSKMNLIDDHSFEMGVTEGTCTTCTASQETTVVELTNTNTASLKMAFTASAGDYEDVTTTSSQYTGVVGLASARIKTDQEGVEFCSIVDGAESACTAVRSDDVWDVYKINSTMSSTSFGYKIVARDSITGSIYADEIFAGSNPIETVVTQGQTEEFNMLPNTANFWDATGSIQTFDIALIPLTGSALVEWNDTTQTRLLAKVKTEVTIDISAQLAAANSVEVYDSSAALLKFTQVSDITNWGTNTYTTIIEAGDYIYFSASSANTRSGGIHILAKPMQNKAVIVSVDDDSMTDTVNAGAITLTAVVTAPTKGTTSEDSVTWRKNGDMMEMHFEYHQTAAGSTGAGIYLFEIPEGYVIDTTKLYGTTTSLDGNVGTGKANSSGATQVILNVYMYNSTHLALWGVNEASRYSISSGTYGLGDTTVDYSFYAKVPIVGWSSRPTALATVQVEDQENTFSAKVTKATGTVSRENTEWIDGDAVITDTSLHTITFTNAFGEVPNCTTTISEETAVTAGLDARIESVSTTSVAVRTGYTNTSSSFQKASYNFVIDCYRTGSDYKAPKVFLGNVTLTEYVSTPSATKPVLVSAKVSGSEVITEDTSSFVSSCTNADPSVCTLNSFFASDPRCWVDPDLSGDVAQVTLDTTTSVTVKRSGVGTSFTLFCHGGQL